MGRLIWLIGASGSGKDSLLMALRQREPEQLLVAHRYITRPANAGGENHIALSEQEFLNRSSKDLFALSWFVLWSTNIGHRIRLFTEQPL